jgi:uncharacterized membrane protein YhaH (DUF805 family)
MDWYLMAWRRFAQFNGRSSRTEYWMFALINFLAIIALGIVGWLGIAFTDHASNVRALFFIPIGIYLLAAIIPGLSVSVRRLHDSDKSGWLLLLLVVNYIPILGIVANLALIVLMCIDSDPGRNEYGPRPKPPKPAVGAYAGNAGFVSPAAAAQPQPIAGVNDFRVCGKCGVKLHDASSFCSACSAQA